MARIEPLWRSDEIELYRFDHPVEHEDQPYENVADAFKASFVECGTFTLEVEERRWRVAAGDVMLQHPGMRFRAGFESGAFNDTCLTLVYRAAAEEAFDSERSWARSGRNVLAATNRLRFLKWTLQRAVGQGRPMLAEYCASEIFRSHDVQGAPLYSGKAFHWYAERVHAARERLDRDYAEELTTSALARSVGMSLFQFTRVFGDLVGAPPHRYLVEARLRAARSMIADGASVTDACFSCGFNNLSHFSRSFRRRFGANPSTIARISAS